MTLCEALQQFFASLSGVSPEAWSVLGSCLQRLSGPVCRRYGLLQQQQDISSEILTRIAGSSRSSRRPLFFQQFNESLICSAELERLCVVYLRRMLANRCVDILRADQRDIPLIQEGEESTETEVPSEEPSIESRAIEKEIEEEGKSLSSLIWSVGERAFVIARDNRQPRYREALKDSWSNARRWVSGEKLRQILPPAATPEQWRATRDAYYKAQERLRKELLQAPSLPDARACFTPSEVWLLGEFCRVVLTRCQRNKKPTVFLAGGSFSMKRADFLREKFGLPNDTQLTPAGTSPRPDSEKGEGLMYAALPPAQLIAEVEKAPSYSVVRAFEKLPEHALQRWDYVPEVFLLQMEGASISVAGDVYLSDDAYILDSRNGMAAAQIMTSQGQSFFLVAENGEVEFYDDVPASLKGQELIAPRLETLLAGAPCAEWLESEVSAGLASSSLWQKTAAVGLLSRLWSPGGRAAEYAEKMMSGWQQPSMRVSQWAAQLSGAQRGAIEKLAMQQIAALSAQLDTLHEAVVEESPEAVSIAVNLLRQRDDIESVDAVLRAAGSRVLEAALAAADLNAQSQMALFVELSLPYDARLSSVSWQEPDAWWGAPYSV